MRKRLLAVVLTLCIIAENNIITSFAANISADSVVPEITSAEEADVILQDEENEEIIDSQEDVENNEKTDISDENTGTEANDAVDNLEEGQEVGADSTSESEEVDDNSDDTSKEQSELQENSWRYTDGVWTPPAGDGITLFSGDAWSFVDGHYINNRGQIIEGAIAKGIDVSEHNGYINWEQVKNSDVKYAIIRCGYGQNYTSQDDKYWERNVSECVRLGIPFGVYLYSYAMTPAAAKSEAEHVLRLISGYKLSYPVFYDLENEGGTYNQASLSSKELGDIAETFCNTISSAGYDVGIYANTNWFTNILTDSRFNNWDKWVAQYNYQCTYGGNYAMWQATSSGVVPGISGNVDINFDFQYANAYWEEIDGNWYYYVDGVMQTGFQMINGQKYYLGDDGICRRSTWVEVDGKKYYAMPDGALRVGWLSFGEDTYYFCGPDAAIVKGVYQVNGLYYYFDENTGVRKGTEPGWHTFYNKTYYTMPDGGLRVGWLSFGDTYYYCGSDAAIVKGLQQINGLYYYFDDKTGIQQARSEGWHQINGRKCYTMPDGGLRIGWLSFGDTYYYCGADAFVVTGKQRIGGNWYYFDAEGVRQQSKWITAGDKKYYAMPDGGLRVGWLSFGNTYYYCGSDAAIVTGKQSINGNWYYFNEDGIRQSSTWINDGNKKYYAMPDGTLRVGWLSFGSTYYYCGSDAAVVTGKQSIGGNWYYFNEDGIRQSSTWINDGDKKYYAMPDGTLRVGWLSFGSTYYYCNSDAEIVTGRQQIDGSWYDFNEEGILQR